MCKSKLQSKFEKFWLESINEIKCKDDHDSNKMRFYKKNPLNSSKWSVTLKKSIKNVDLNMTPHPLSVQNFGVGVNNYFEPFP